MKRYIFLEYRKLNNFRYSALGFGEFCEIPQGVTVTQQASGLLCNARGVKPLWKISTKVLILILFICIPFCLQAEFYSEIWSGVQFNHPTDSSVAPAQGRLRFGGIFTTKSTNILFHMRCAAAFGRTNFGSCGLMTLPNDVSIDKKALTIDQAYFLFPGKRFTFTAGLIDPYSSSGEYPGFFKYHLIGDENTGFLSTHLLKLLANHSMDNYKHQSIPAIFMFINITQRIRLKTGITLGKAATHIALRNTLPLELELLFKSFHLSINAGFTDAHASKTHRISPSYGLIIEKKLFLNIIIFGKFSVVGKDITTFRTPDDAPSYRYSVANMFSPFHQHYAAGFAGEHKRFGWGLGYSNLRQFHKGIPEQLVEAFVRFKIFDIFELSPDFQYIINPNGQTIDKYMWIAGFRMFYKFNLGADSV